MESPKHNRANKSVELKVPSDGLHAIAHLPISLYYRVLLSTLVSIANSLCRSTRSLGLNERK